MYELPQELPNDLTLTILVKKEISGKLQNLVQKQLSAQSPYFSTNQLLVGQYKKTGKKKGVNTA